MYTAAIMKTELEASKGTRKLDMRIDNIQLVNVFTREIYPASIGIYNERIVAVGRVETEADQVIDGAGAYAVPGLIDSHIHIETTLLTPEALGEVIIPWGTTTLCVDAMEMPTWQVLTVCWQGSRIQRSCLSDCFLRSLPEYLQRLDLRQQAVCWGLKK